MNGNTKTDPVIMHRRTAPPAPIVVASDITSSQVQLAWSTIEDISHYVLDVFPKTEQVPDKLQEWRFTFFTCDKCFGAHLAFTDCLFSQCLINLKVPISNTVAYQLTALEGAKTRYTLSGTNQGGNVRRK